MSFCAGRVDFCTFPGSTKMHDPTVWFSTLTVFLGGSLFGDKLMSPGL